MATTSGALAIAIQHHQAGRLQAAEQIYRQILQAEPNNADALHLLGVTAHQAGKHELAIETIGRAIGLQGNAASFHGNLGTAYHALRKFPEAADCYRRALELKPDYADAAHNLGNVLKDQGKLDEAAACWRRALELKPDYAAARNNLDNVSRDQVNPDALHAGQLLDWLVQAAHDRSNPNLTLQRILNRLLGVAMDSMSQRIAQVTGLVVQSGPFASMRYVSRSAGSTLGPKLVGCYEAELHTIIEGFAARGYRRVINIGCGEGYYAVGLARLLPSVSVVAFDIDPAAQELCRQLALANNVADRVSVAGECRAADLAPLITPDSLVFCDIEGGERQLLDPALVPALATCDILVELHDFMDPAISSLVSRRFAGSHDVTMIPQRGRNPFAYPLLAGLSQFDQFLAVVEGRPGPTPWAFMTVRKPVVWSCRQVSR